ncbi:YdcF family protein [Amycolatopsis sp. FDAARGOS 1241]|uniref:YdcF family protein n=1 Tax=Amycolatopsis sp. FDAARGOS 1241 TaxID=2778070 RepID=UPI0019515824|nr:YdcF family protein [Amycolatopsis sp. FDAARGOS 1241]QRP44650.1 YdcF family protein [Amycolatopsis sp. FDAARGOS 1241]
MAPGILALIADLIFVVRFLREPRRFGNAVWFAIALLFTALWLFSLTAGLVWVQVVVLIVVGVVAAMSALVLPWALIANGVVMWRREGHRPANMLSLLAGLAMLGIFVVTLAALVFLRESWLLVLAASALLVSAYLAFVFTALLLYSVLYSRVNRRARADAVIVLGSGLLGDRVPPLLASRLDRGAQVLRRSPDAVVVVSGGRGSDELTSEAAAMASYLENSGVPRSAVLLEDRATTTDENLRFSVDVLHHHGISGRFLAVTNNYHVFRTAVLARRLGLKLDVIGAKTASYFVPSAFLREFVALLVQYKKTNIAVLVVLGGFPPALALATVL